MYSIVKRSKAGRRHGVYQLLGRGGVLKLDPSLGPVLRFLDSRRTALVKS
jgi:hypothetical protein